MEQLLRLQSEAPFITVEPQAVLTPVVFVDTDGGQQQRQHRASAASKESDFTAITHSDAAGSTPFPRQRDSPGAPAGPHGGPGGAPNGDPKARALEGPPLVLSDEDDSADEDEEEWDDEYEDRVVGPELAEKKWKAYIKDQASPMAEFFAGQVRIEYSGLAPGIQGGRRAAADSGYHFPSFYA